jgi:tetratricopeptide (TPR) repeat protein
LARVLLDRDRELQAANSLGIALALSGQAADGLTLLEQVLPLVQMQADGESKQAFYSHYGYVLGALGRFREAAAAVQQAADLALAMGDLDSASTEEGNLAAMLGYLGDRVGALQAVERALDCWRLMGEPAGVASAANHMRAGNFYTLAGRYREALAAHTQALQMFRAGQAALWASFTEHQLARVWLELGQPARALQTLTPLAPAPSAQVHNMRLMVQASIRLQLGRPDPQALRQGLTDDAALMTIEWSGGQLMLAALLPAEEGLVICEQLQARSLGRHPTVVQHARVRQADCLRRLGRVAEAAELAQEALAAPDPTSAVWMSVPEFLWLAAQALEAGGQQAHAKRTVAQAADWLRVAQAQVPPAFVESFRDRNPTHRALLLRAAALQA